MKTKIETKKQNKAENMKKLQVLDKTLGLLMQVRLYLVQFEDDKVINKKLDKVDKLSDEISNYYNDIWEITWCKNKSFIKDKEEPF